MHSEEIEYLKNWLLSADLECPRTKFVNALPEVEAEYIEGTRLCATARNYLSSCVPARALDFQYGPTLYDVEGINFVCGDHLWEVCAQGFIAIGEDSIVGDPYFLDLRTGSVHLYSLGNWCGDSLMANGTWGLPVTYENVVTGCTHHCDNPAEFLSYLKREISACLVDHAWDIVLGGMEKAVGDPGYIPDFRYVESMKEVLSTSIDARMIRDEEDKSLLEVARKRGRQAVLPVLEAYWENPEIYRPPPNSGGESLN